MMAKHIQELNSMRPIAYFEKRYAITEEGVVINLANNSILKPTKQKNGYLKVALAKGKQGKVDQQLLHILVAKHFIPNPYGHPQVNHKNGNKEDCRVVNLEWVTAKENCLHAFQTGLRPGYMSADDKEHYLQRVLLGEQVNDIAFEISRRPETLHKMLRETAKRLGIHDQWQTVMKENRRNAAIRNLRKINN